MHRPNNGIRLNAQLTDDPGRRPRSLPCWRPRPVPRGRLHSIRLPDLAVVGYRKLLADGADRRPLTFPDSQ